MIETYCSMIIDQWVEYYDLLKTEPERADKELKRFHVRIKGFLPITDIQIVQSADELKFDKSVDGGFVIISMLQDHEGAFPFVPVIDQYHLLTADYFPRKGWTAVYAYEPPPEVED